MTTEDFIIEWFCWVDDQMGAIAKYPQAKLYPSELVTIGLLFALKGGYFRVYNRCSAETGLRPLVCGVAGTNALAAGIAHASSVV